MAELGSRTEPLGVDENEQETAGSSSRDSSQQHPPPDTQEMLFPQTDNVTDAAQGCSVDTEDKDPLVSGYSRAELENYDFRAVMARLRSDSAHLVEIVDLQKTDLRDETAAKLSSQLSGCVGLKQINLSMNLLGDEGAVALADGLAKCLGTLEILELSGNKVGARGAKHLATTVLRGATRLVELDMDNNYVCDDGAVAVAQSLRDCTSLRRLSLSNNNLTDLAAKALVSLLRQNSYIVAIEIFDNPNVSADCMAQVEGEIAASRRKSMEILSDLKVARKSPPRPHPGSIAENDRFFEMDGEEPPSLLADGVMVGVGAHEPANNDRPETHRLGDDDAYTEARSVLEDCWEDGPCSRPMSPINSSSSGMPMGSAAVNGVLRDETDIDTLKQNISQLQNALQSAMWKVETLTHTHDILLIENQALGRENSHLRTELDSVCQGQNAIILENDRLQRELFFSIGLQIKEGWLSRGLDCADFDISMLYNEYQQEKREKLRLRMEALVARREGEHQPSEEGGGAAAFKANSSKATNTDGSLDDEVTLVALLNKEMSIGKWIHNRMEEVRVTAQRQSTSSLSSVPDMVEGRIAAELSRHHEKTKDQSGTEKERGGTRRIWRKKKNSTEAMSKRQLSNPSGGELGEPLQSENVRNLLALGSNALRDIGRLEETQEFVRTTKQLASSGVETVKAITPMSESSEPQQDTSRHLEQFLASSKVLGSRLKQTPSVQRLLVESGDVVSLLRKRRRLQKLMGRNISMLDDIKSGISLFVEEHLRATRVNPIFGKKDTAIGTLEFQLEKMAFTSVSVPPSGVDLRFGAQDIRVVISNLSARLDNFRWKYRQGNWPFLQDEGNADAEVVNWTTALSLKITLTEKVPIITVTDVCCSLGNLDFTISGCKAKWLYTKLVGTFTNKLAFNLQNNMTAKLRSVTSILSERINIIAGAYWPRLARILKAALAKDGSPCPTPRKRSENTRAHGTEESSDDDDLMSCLSDWEEQGGDDLDEQYDNAIAETCEEIKKAKTR